MSSNTSISAKRARTEQSPATLSSVARGRNHTPVIDGHDAARAVNTSQQLAANLRNCHKELEARDKIIEEKDAEIQALKSERRIQNEVIDALGGNEMLAEALSAEQSRNNSQGSAISDLSHSSQEAKKTTENEKKQEKREDEKDRDDEGEADTTA